jgi:pimeloyl-ACP methyl ester carboxylesterase
MFKFLEDEGRMNANVTLHSSYRNLHLELRADELVSFASIGSDGVRVSDTAPPDGAHCVLTATRQSWETQKQTAAPRGFQALSTMRRLGTLEVSGDMLAFNQNLLLLEMLFVPRERSGQSSPTPVAEPFLEDVVGRYLNLEIQGRPHRVYFEEAGEGIPLVCLHTAGADARQYRHLLNDPDITSRFRVIAFDLPWHGKSSPPQGFESEVYALTTDLYVDTVMAFKRALKLDDAVVMGCSIGGRVVLHLAQRHGEELRAVIGLQSALFAVDKTGNVEPGSQMVLNRPDVHGGKIAGALMNGVMAPRSPVEERWETMWHYMQGGPGVFMGDLHYYFEDGDLRNGGTRGLDVAQCPIYLLSGEYDPSATPEMGEALAKEIGATHFEVMKDMGHFPMSENPELFRTYLLPVLSEIDGPIQSAT